MIEASGIKILADHLPAGKAVLGYVRIVSDRTIWQMIESQEFLGVWIYDYGNRISVGVMNHPVARIQRRNGGDCGYAFGLANALVVEEEKCPLWNDWPADGSTKLVALERRDLRAVEEIPGVQRAVAEEFVSAAVKSTRARAGDGVNDAA